MVAPKKKRKPGALKVVGRINAMSANKTDIPEGKCILTMEIVGERKHRQSLEVLAPEEDAWHLVGAQCEITILPTRNGKPVEWIEEKE